MDTYVRPITFRERLRRADDWTPELREYAIRYLVANTNRVDALLLQTLAGVPEYEQSLFKTESARMVVGHLSPSQLLLAWNALKAAKGYAIRASDQPVRGRAR